jgi:hypothetical protein
LDDVAMSFPQTVSLLLLALDPKILLVVWMIDWMLKEAATMENE